MTEAIRARRMRSFRRVALGLGFPLGLLLVWEVLVGAGVVDHRFFPAPHTIVVSAAALLANADDRGALLKDLEVTGLRLVIGYAAGALLGIAVGMAMGLYEPIRDALRPFVNATMPTPKLAIFPLLIVLFGIGDASKIALVVIGVFYMTGVSTLSGVQYSSPIYRDVATAFRLPIWTRWTSIVVPAALPSIVTGLKLGLGQALILVVSAEFVAAQAGIGHFIWNAWQVLDIPRMFVGLVIVSLAGGVAVFAGEILERRLTPWAID